MNGASKKQRIHERLESLERKGNLSPESVVKDARNESSPLHGEFEWDDRKAGHRWRVVQARSLIQHHQVYIERRSHTIAAPSYVRDPEAKPREGGYRSTVALSTDRERAMQALISEAGRAASHLERVRNLSVALNLENEVEEVLRMFTVFRVSVGTQDAKP